MLQKIPCIRCGASILPTTAERNNGLCAPCFKSKEDLPEEFNTIVDILF